jgi:hypothetical protein
MLDQELLDDFLETLELAGGPVKNPVLPNQGDVLRHPGRIATTLRTPEL